MLPVIALVGRPNVGKSTLFNRLTRSRDALVDDQPGVTRDRLYGRGIIRDRFFLVVDTGGIDSIGDGLASLIREQVDQVISESDVILFITSAEDGLVTQDLEIADTLRKSERKVLLLVNKTEGRESQLVTSEYQELALGQPRAISAKRGDGVEAVISTLLDELDRDTTEEDAESGRIAIVGRPNVGKSTLTNKLAGESRVIVSEQPGTTRDSVYIPISADGNSYTIIDTAGVRKKSKIEEKIEKFSVVKTMQAIERCNVALLVIDASTGIAAQDVAIAGMVNDFGRSIVIIVNKWDRLQTRHRTKVKQDIEARFSFLPDPEYVFVSARFGSNLAKVLPAATRALSSAMIEIATSSLNRALQDAITQTPPPMHNRRPVRLKFAHQAGKNPPVIVVHGNQANAIPESYRRYLSRYFARSYSLVGTPVRIVTKVGHNPYRDKSAARKSYKKRSGRRRKL